MTDPVCTDHQDATFLIPLDHVYITRHDGSIWTPQSLPDRVPSDVISSLRRICDLVAIDLEAGRVPGFIARADFFSSISVKVWSMTDRDEIAWSIDGQIKHPRPFRARLEDELHPDTLLRLEKLLSPARRCLSGTTGTPKEISLEITTSLDDLSNHARLRLTAMAAAVV